MAEENNPIELPQVPEDEFTLSGQVYAFPEHADALERIYTETTRLAASEPGMIYYCISRDAENRNLFHFFERYKGRKAFEEHTKQPILQRLLSNEDKYVREVKASIAKPVGV